MAMKKMEQKGMKFTISNRLLFTRASMVVAIITPMSDQILEVMIGIDLMTSL